MASPKNKAMKIKKPEAAELQAWHSLTVMLKQTRIALKSQTPGTPQRLYRVLGKFSDAKLLLELLTSGKGVELLDGD